LFCVSIYKSPDDGSQLEPKHLAVNQMTKTGVVCDLFGTYNCEIVQNALTVIKTITNNTEYKTVKEREVLLSGHLLWPVTPH